MRAKHDHGSIRRRGRTESRLQTQALSQPDWVFLAITLGLLLFGLLMVFDASVIEAYVQFGDKYYFAKRHALWACLGLLAMSVTSLVPLTWVKNAAKPLFITSIVLLVAVLIPGIGNQVQGARRWISLGFFNLQPSEVAKFAVAVYFSSWLAKHQRVEPFLTLMALILGLLLLEPDMGTALVITGIALTMFFLSGARLKHLFLIGLAGLLIGSMLIFASPYRRERVATFLNPQNDPLGASYHIRQVIIGLGSGGLYGTGIGRSRQKYQYLPEAATDSIFAVIAEEIGFIGAGVVIGIYAIAIIRGFTVARRIEDTFAQLLALTVISWLGVQTVLNLSTMVVLVPLTGVPLPFISHGGSSLITIMAGLGLYLNASRYRSAGRFTTWRTSLGKSRRRR